MVYECCVGKGLEEGGRGVFGCGVLRTKTLVAQALVPVPSALS